MRVAAVVELTPGPQADLFQRILKAAYRASREGVVLLLLRGVSRDVVGDLLDSVVAEDGTSVEGVLYLEAPEEEEALEACRHASVVVTATEPFRTRVRARGIPAVDLHEGPLHLEDLAGTGVTPSPRTAGSGA